MIYGSTVLATDFGPDPWHARLLRLLLFFTPRANPDNEPMYPYVKRWYLELDDSVVPAREIGVDSEGKPLFGAPDKRNAGFWTDTTEKFKQAHLHPIPAEEFERLWHEVQRARTG